MVICLKLGMQVRKFPGETRLSSLISALQHQPAPRMKSNSPNQTRPVSTVQILLASLRPKKAQDFGIEPPRFASSAAASSAGRLYRRPPTDPGPASDVGPSARRLLMSPPSRRAGPVLATGSCEAAPGPRASRAGRAPHRLPAGVECTDPAARLRRRRVICGSQASSIARSLLPPVTSPHHHQ